MNFVFRSFSGPKKTDAGTVLQVVSTTKTDADSYTADSTWEEISGLNATITPKQLGSKVLVRLSLCGAANDQSHVRMLRDGVSIVEGDDQGDAKIEAMMGTLFNGGANDVKTLCSEFLDSPSGHGPFSYTVEVYTPTLVGESYINRSVADSISDSHGRYVSTITLMEIST